MTENELSKKVVDICIKVHRKLGPGLLESVYEEILFYELNKCGVKCKKQQGIPLTYNDMKFNMGFRADIIVEDKIIIELKSVEELMPVHKKQVLTYLKILDLKLGLLINFNVPLIKNGIKRIVNNL